MITSHSDGDIVHTPTIRVAESASPGSEVVRDIRFRPDARTTTAGDGSWSFEIDLNDGRNVLKFRLADDTSTTIEMTVVLDEQASSVDPTQTASPRPTRVATASPRPTRVATPSPRPTRVASPTATASSSSPTPPAADALAFAQRVCVGTTYQRCADSMLTAAQSLSGELVAICEYADSQGDVVWLDSGNGADAEAECSGGGLIFPSRVFAVVRLP